MKKTAAAGVVLLISMIIVFVFGGTSNAQDVQTDDPPIVCTDTFDEATQDDSCSVPTTTIFTTDECAAQGRIGAHCLPPTAYDQSVPLTHPWCAGGYPDSIQSARMGRDLIRSGSTPEEVAVAMDGHCTSVDPCDPRTNTTLWHATPCGEVTALASTQTSAPASAARSLPATGTVSAPILAAAIITLLAGLTMLIITKKERTTNG